MTYQEMYDKLIKHAERFEPWAKMQKELGKKIGAGKTALVMNK